MGDDDVIDGTFVFSPVQLPSALKLAQSQARALASNKNITHTFSIPLQGNVGSQMKSWSDFKIAMNRTVLSVLCENVKLDAYGSLRWGESYLKQMTESLVLGTYRKVTISNIEHSFDNIDNTAYTTVKYSTNGSNALEQTISVAKVHFYGILAKDSFNDVFEIEDGSQHDYDLFVALLVGERPELIPEKFLREDDWLNFRDCSESIASSYEGGHVDDGALLFILRVMCLGYKPGVETIQVNIDVDDTAEGAQ